MCGGRLPGAPIAARKGHPKLLLERRSRSEIGGKLIDWADDLSIGRVFAYGAVAIDVAHSVSELGYIHGRLIAPQKLGQKIPCVVFQRCLASLQIGEAYRAPIVDESRIVIRIFLPRHVDLTGSGAA